MSELLNKYKVHHIGCAVRSIKESLNTYENTLGFKNVSEVYHLDDIGINACFVELREGFFIELIEPSADNSIVNNLLKKGVSYYHIGYKVSGVDSVVKELLEKDFREVSTVLSPAFSNRKCVFMLTPQLQLVELIDSD